jgi:toll-like receptor 13
LLKKLESSNLNICIHHRDFDVGEHITNNIEKYMSKCWKIIVVMSNQFAESEWCQWEIIKNKFKKVLTNVTLGECG